MAILSKGFASISLRRNWSYRDELSVENALIMKGMQILIPAGLQSSYLKIFTQVTKDVKCVNYVLRAVCAGTKLTSRLTM